MQKSFRRAVMGAAVVLAGSLLMAPATGCLSFITESAFTNADFCFIFDCQNGLFGGTIDPCGADAQNQNRDPLFTDCP